MLKNITLGQYFPGDTFIHRLDPRTKLLATIAFIVALFLARGAASYALCAAFLAVCVVISKIKIKALFSGLKPILIIILITDCFPLFQIDLNSYKSTARRICYKIGSEFHDRSFLSLL